jgi:hypothetical protein
MMRTQSPAGGGALGDELFLAAGALEHLVRLLRRQRGGAAGGGRTQACGLLGQLARDSRKRRVLLDMGVLVPVATMVLEATHPSARATAAATLATLVLTAGDARAALVVGFHAPAAQLPLLEALVRAEARHGEEAEAAGAALAALSRADVACAGYDSDEKAANRDIRVWPS